MNPKIKKILSRLSTILFFGIFIFWYGYMEREDAPYFVFAKSYVSSNSALNNKLGSSWQFGDFEALKLLNGEPVVTFDIIGSQFAECIRLQLEETNESDYKVVSVHAGKKSSGIMASLGPKCSIKNLQKIET